jgi:hypothetical protein
MPITWPPIRMDHAIIRPSQSLVKGGGPAAQFRLSDGVTVTYLFQIRRIGVELRFPRRSRKSARHIRTEPKSDGFPERLEPMYE